ncbi:MAG TPA: hypothetical protein ENF45_07175 [Bacteroidetes bacterium]|nr:hypothetical protein [Bacteroidota bacterium]
MYRLSTPQEEREFEVFIEALFKQDNPIKVQKELHSLNVPAPYRLRIKVLYSSVSVRDAVDRLVEKGKLQSFNTESGTYLFQTMIGKRKPIEVRLPFFIESFEQQDLHKNVQAIIAICKTNQWNVLRRLFKNSYPKVVPILLPQAELIQSARRLKMVTGHSVNVRALSAKESFNGEKGTFKKSVRVWTDEELERALHSIQDRRQIITSIDIEFFPVIGGQTHVRPTAICKIRKNGEIEVTGSYKLAFDAVAKQIAEVGERKLRFFAGRGLRLSQYKPRPLAINFIQPVFQKTDSIRRFVQILSKYPKSMHAVEHGNPYAHVKLTDIYDGSSFDVWAISPSRIALMPGLKASEAAFERLVDYIFDQFREGQIADYGHEGKTLESSTGQG